MLKPPEASHGAGSWRLVTASPCSHLSLGQPGLGNRERPEGPRSLMAGLARWAGPHMKNLWNTGHTLNASEFKGVQVHGIMYTTGTWLSRLELDLWRSWKSPPESSLGSHQKQSEFCGGTETLFNNKPPSPNNDGVSSAGRECLGCGLTGLLWARPLWSHKAEGHWPLRKQLWRSDQNLTVGSDS